MTPELTYLVLSAVLAFAQIVIAAAAAALQIGVLSQIGNRENLPEFSGFCGRAVRAYRNMLENLALFTIFVLTANAADVSTAMTVLGAQIFFYARAAYAIVYMIGVPFIRSAIWGASVAGMALIAGELLARAVY